MISTQGHVYKGKIVVGLAENDRGALESRRRRREDIESRSSNKIRAEQLLSMISGWSVGKEDCTLRRMDSV